MKKLSISITPEQYEFIKKLAIERYESRFSQALRLVIQTFIVTSKK
ncbi:MAG TPA: hypothetical protein VFF49_11255 [Thermodesulfobacteriota bacterium]|nr:hypothetical protein [Thermodesulfobacteriota bacterium]